MYLYSNQYYVRRILTVQDLPVSPELQYLYSYQYLYGQKIGSQMVGIWDSPNTVVTSVLLFQDKQQDPR